MTIEIGLIFTLVGCLLSMSTFLIGRLTAAKKDGVAVGRIESEITHIKDSLEELKSDYKSANIQAIQADVNRNKADIAAIWIKVNAMSK